MFWTPYSFSGLFGDLRLPQPWPISMVRSLRLERCALQDQRSSSRSQFKRYNWHTRKVSYLVHLGLYSNDGTLGNHFDRHAWLRDKEITWLDACKYLLCPLWVHDAILVDRRHSMEVQPNWSVLLGWHSPPRNFKRELAQSYNCWRGTLLSKVWCIPQSILHRYLGSASDRAILGYHDRHNYLLLCVLYGQEGTAMTIAQQLL